MPESLSSELWWWSCLEEIRQALRELRVKVTNTKWRWGERMKDQDSSKVTSSFYKQCAWRKKNGPWQPEWLKYCLSSLPYYVWIHLDDISLTLCIQIGKWWFIFPSIELEIFFLYLYLQNLWKLWGQTTLPSCLSSGENSTSRNWEY